MQPLSAAEVRERFLSFFVKRGHQRMPSDSLVPTNDPSLLFTGSGMNQFKDMFLGKGSLPYKRITTSQKCLRVPDLDEVGKTPRHHTFFEMLGNFSFGDYFKAECIPWEWEFFNVELGIPEDQMVVTVYRDDDEAYEIWRDKVGLSEDKIFRFGEKENFWPAEAPSKGPNGPCGPCSEIYFDHRPGEPYPKKKGLKELPGDRFTEIGNCVFTQFDRQPDGTLAPLPQRNIDVGLGLERITAVLAGVPTNFDTDLFQPYVQFLSELSGKAYGSDPQVDERMRRIADHLRAVTFCIADGAVPSNLGRGYVVRKILRRAARDGYELGIDGSFLHRMVDLVAEVMGGAYPELRSHAGQCRSLIEGEEAGFAAVYAKGMNMLGAYLDRAPKPAGKRPKVLEGSGEFAFKLHDTHGFPVDITVQVMAERGHLLDEAEFDKLMEEQRKKNVTVIAEELFGDHEASVLREHDVPPTEFIGYGELVCESRIRALIGEGHKMLERAAAGDELLLIAETTPFYAQGGGQVGDRGRVSTPTGAGKITETTALEGYYLHTLRVDEGHLEVGQECRLAVDEPARRATERNHTATHLLHAALKNQLGDQVTQAGSEVAPERLRFDYTWGKKLTDGQIEALEREVNQQIMAATPVEARVRPKKEADAAGFIALFGEKEKYGEEVRTLSVGEYSRELCGGTHVANTGNIGAFRITSDSAMKAGARRLEAITGEAALLLSQAERSSLQDMAHTLKVPSAELPQKVAALLEEGKKLRKELQKAQAADLDQLLGQLREAAVSTGQGTTALFECQGLTAKEIQELLTRARKALEPFAGVVLSRDTDHDLVREISKAMGGGGGGRPELAQGKGRDPGRLAEAISTARTMLAEAGLSD